LLAKNWKMFVEFADWPFNDFIFLAANNHKRVTYRLMYSNKGISFCEAETYLAAVLSQVAHSTL